MIPFLTVLAEDDLSTPVIMAIVISNTIVALAVLYWTLGRRD